MDYYKVYDAIIARAHNRLLEGYSEQHHILPRCLGGIDDPTNIVKLTAEEHFICHQLLAKMHPGDSRLLAAAMFMTGGHQPERKNNKTYGWLKRQWSAHMRKNNPNAAGNARRKYLSEHGSVSRKPNNDVSVEGHRVLSDKMRGDRNPCAGIRPWKHPRATEYTKSVWRNSDHLYALWMNNDKPSYGRLYMLKTDECYTKSTGVIAPYISIVKYFRDGWIPTQDNDWIAFNADDN